MCILSITGTQLQHSNIEVPMQKHVQLNQGLRFEQEVYTLKCFHALVRVTALWDCTVKYIRGWLRRCANSDRVMQYSPTEMAETMTHVPVSHNKSGCNLKASQGLDDTFTMKKTNCEVAQLHTDPLVQNQNHNMPLRRQSPSCILLLKLILGLLENKLVVISLFFR